VDLLLDSERTGEVKNCDLWVVATSIRYFPVASVFLLMPPEAVKVILMTSSSFFSLRLTSLLVMICQGWSWILTFFDSKDWTFAARSAAEGAAFLVRSLVKF